VFEYEGYIPPVNLVAFLGEWVCVFYEGGCWERVYSFS